MAELIETVFESKEGADRSARHIDDRVIAPTTEESLSRALRSNNLWLAVAYVGLLVLMARVYA